NDLASVAFGRHFWCALHADHAVTCAGASNDGQLGDVVEVYRGPGARGETWEGPLAVPRVAGAIEIATGSSHACALDAKGRVQCWGDDSGQLGRGRPVTDASP